MNKKYISLVFFMLISFLVFAKETLGDAITRSVQNIIYGCSEFSIIAIDDFDSASSRLTLYIRECFADSFFEQDSHIKIVTRDHMDKIEAELRFQNSGKVSTKTIISAAERLGAQALVFGSLEDSSDGYIFKVSMLDVKTGTYLYRRTFELPFSQVIEGLSGRSPVYSKVAVGFTGEVNKNSLDFIAPAAGLSFDYSLFRKISLGSRIIVSYDLQEKNNQLITSEILGTVRWYIVSPSGKPSSGVFMEGLFGLDLIFVNSGLKYSPAGGVASGCRFTLKHVYFEPEIRVGYPFLAGAQISAGFRF